MWQYYGEERPMKRGLGEEESAIEIEEREKPVKKGAQRLPVLPHSFLISSVAKKIHVVCH